MSMHRSDVMDLSRNFTNQMQQKRHTRKYPPQDVAVAHQCQWQSGEHFPRQISLAHTAPDTHPPKQVVPSSRLCQSLGDLQAIPFSRLCQSFENLPWWNLKGMNRYRNGGEVCHGLEQRIRKRCQWEENTQWYTFSREIYKQTKLYT